MRESMGESLRCSRAGAFVMALVLATSGLFACIHPRTAAAARACCAKQCHHDSSGQRAMDCCRAHQTPAEQVAVASVAPPAEGATLVAAVALPAPARATIAPGGTHAHDPPHVAIFRQRCALLL